MSFRLVGELLASNILGPHPSPLPMGEGTGLEDNGEIINLRFP